MCGGLCEVPLLQESIDTSALDLLASFFKEQVGYLLRGGGSPQCLTVLLSVPAVCDHGLFPDPAPHREAGA